MVEPVTLRPVVDEKLVVGAASILHHRALESRVTETVSVGSDLD